MRPASSALPSDELGVDDEHLDSLGGVLSRDSREAALEIRAAVLDGDDDRDH